MLGDKLTEAVSEVQGVLRAVGQVDVVSFDAAVHGFGRASTIDGVASKLKGCGGTSFVPAFEFLDKQRSRLDVAIFFTDGWGDAPPKPPKYRVIWALVGEGASSPCDWGAVVNIKTG
jgi:predicted metal-dependent peptidase